MRFSVAYDVCIIPFAPVTEEDDVEIRLQCLNDGRCAESVTIRVACDSAENVLYTESKTVLPGSYAFFSFRARFLQGEHTLIFWINGQMESCPLPVQPRRTALLSGGFVMLGPPNDRVPCDPFRDAIKRMTDADWERYIDAMNEIDMRFIIITVTVQRLLIEAGIDRAHYASRLFPRSDIAATDPIAAILRTADKNGQKVFLGLGHTYGGHLKNNAAIMTELYEQYHTYPSFYGWYQSEEANFHYFDPQELGRHAEIAAVRDRLSPVKPLLISPYFICREDPAATSVNEELLTHFEETSPDFDILMPQDMVGQRRLTVDRAAAIYERMHRSCTISGVHLWANCEAFNFAENHQLYPRFQDGGFFGQEGYEGQLQGVYRHAEKIGAFMLSGFFTPPDFSPCMGGERSVSFYQDYIKYRRKIREGNML